VVRTFLEEIDLYEQKIKDAGSRMRLVDSWRPSIMSFRFTNGSEILFRSCDEPSKFKSLNLDGFALDEPVDIDEEIFLMLQGRLRGGHTKHHLGVLAGNPAGYGSWVYKRFFDHPTEEYKAVHTTTYDNSFLPADYVTSCEQSFDEDYANRYLRGEWGDFEGLIYKDFDYDSHVGDFKNLDYEYYIGGYDDGFRNPACLLTLGVDAEKHIHVINEFYEKERTTDQIVSEISEINRIYPMRKVFADPSAQAFIEAAKLKRLRVYDADNDVDSGIARLKTFFKNDLVLVDRGCKHLIEQLQSYRYEKDRFSKNATERPLKKNDHACDALRYSVTDFNPFKKPIFCAGGRWH